MIVPEQKAGYGRKSTYSIAFWEADKFIAEEIPWHIRTV
jgi:hypothetical protein